MYIYMYIYIFLHTHIYIHLSKSIEINLNLYIYLPKGSTRTLVSADWQLFPGLRECLLNPRDANLKKIEQ